MRERFFRCVGFYRWVRVGGDVLSKPQRGLVCVPFFGFSVNYKSSDISRIRHCRNELRCQIKYLSQIGIAEFYFGSISQNAIAFWVFADFKSCGVFRFRRSRNELRCSSRKTLKPNRQRRFGFLFNIIGQQFFTDYFCFFHSFEQISSAVGAGDVDSAAL